MVSHIGVLKRAFLAPLVIMDGISNITDVLMNAGVTCASSSGSSSRRIGYWADFIMSTDTEFWLSR